MSDNTDASMERMEPPAASLSEGLRTALIAGFDEVAARRLEQLLGAAVPGLGCHRQEDPAALAVDPPGGEETLLVLPVRSGDRSNLELLAALRRAGHGLPALVVGCPDRVAEEELAAASPVALLPEEAVTARQLGLALLHLGVSARRERRRLALEWQLETAHGACEEAQQRLQQVSEQFASLAVEGQLTGRGLTRSLTERIEEEMQNARRARARLSCLLLRVDGLPELRHRHGTAYLDFVLFQVGDRLRRTIRGNDLMARQGEGDFVVVSRVGGPQDALAQARRLEGVVTGETYGRVAIERVKIGLAFFGGKMQRADELLEAAARALTLLEPEEPAAELPAPGVFPRLAAG
jgi:diguanylate cyclase (GGDEF)-like protein